MSKMGTKCLFSSTTFPLPTFISLLLLSSTYQTVLAKHNQLTTKPNRKALEIGLGGGGVIIGGGGSPSPSTSPDCPPPPPPKPVCPPPPPPKPVCPPPPPSPALLCPPPVAPGPPPLLLTELAGKVLKRFAARITRDPYNILKSWTGRNACDYQGVLCTFFDKHKQDSVYGLEFSGFNWEGPNLVLDDFIEQLPDLTFFHANSNGLKGKIPVLSHLPYFSELDLSNNKYVGGFPNNVLGATNLVFLDLRFNSFEGMVPPQVYNLGLLALFLNNNFFQQQLPSELCSTPASFLTLANNKFFGQIPKFIGQLANTLREVLFLNNTLSGCLPYEIGLLKKARVFDTSCNQLTGPIPHSFACLAKMEYLILDHNQHYGPVPEFVCKLPVLGNLTLNHNYFTQVGSECMKLIRKKVLDVKMNCILGLPNQRSPEECAWFFSKPKSCPESNMYNYIPCKGTAAYLQSDVASEEAPQPQPTLSYSALSPKTNR